MGNFDWVDYECICPICRNKVDGFQTKDGKCMLEKLKFSDVHKFYSYCNTCGCSIQFDKIKDKYNITVYGKKNKLLYKKLIKIKR